MEPIRLRPASMDAAMVIANCRTRPIRPMTSPAICRNRPISGSRGSGAGRIAGLPASDVGANARAERIGHQRPERVDAAGISLRLHHPQRLAGIVLGPPPLE